METREIAKLKPNPRNPRGAVLHDVALRELAMSIKSVGVLEPIIITPQNLIVAGHRRVEAAKLAEVESVSVIVRDLKPFEQVQVMLIENLQRASLNILQESAAYVWLIGQGLTPSQVSKAIGVSSSRIAECIAVQSLPSDLHPDFLYGILPLSCASPLATLPTAIEQRQWADKAVERKWNGTALRNAIKGESKARTGSRETNSPLGNIVEALERIDKKLDSESDCRPTQILLRQAVSRLIEVESLRRRVENRQAGRFKVFDKSSSSLMQDTT